MRLSTLLMITMLPALAAASTMNTADLPTPEAGKCYARVVIPATYKVMSEKVMVAPETHTLKAVPAKYGFETEKVIVKEASQKTKIIPATYKTVKEKVMIEEEKKILTAVPAKYKTVNKQVLVKAAGHEWKKGTGLYQKVDHATGEILCYKETPAVYKTVKETVLVSPATTVEKIIPAKFSYIEKRVIDKPEQIIKTDIPAVTRNVRVKKMLKAPSELKTTKPAVYKTVNTKVLDTKSSTEWRSVLCSTNATRPKIKLLQQGLAKSGFYKGPIDGIYGKQTLSAVTRFQGKNSMATGGLTEETLNKLSIDL